MQLAHMFVTSCHPSPCGFTLKEPHKYLSALTVSTTNLRAEVSAGERPFEAPPEPHGFPVLGCAAKVQV